MKEKIKIQMLNKMFGMGFIAGILVMVGIHFLSPLDKPNIVRAVIGLVAAILVAVYNIHKINKLKKDL